MNLERSFSGEGPGLDFSKDDSELLGSIKCGELVDLLDDCCLLFHGAT
jgi:hypothetical protein